MKASSKCDKLEKAMTTSVKKSIKTTHVNNTGKENYSCDCKMLYAYK